MTVRPMNPQSVLWPELNPHLIQIDAPSKTRGPDLAHRISPPTPPPPPRKKENHQ